MSRPLPDSQAYEDEMRRRRSRRLRRVALLLVLLACLAAIAYLIAGGPLPEAPEWLEAL